MSERFHRDDARAAIPLTRVCPECQEDMELITADDVGEVLVYECPECGSQQELRIENEGDDPPEADTLLPGPDVWPEDDEDAEVELDQEEPDESE
ncbi:MAG TPA: hypothetical protein VGZ23_09725 [bacterium]|nr:hypothetical protein [bacterium]